MREARRVVAPAALAPAALATTALAPLVLLAAACGEGDAGSAGTSGPASAPAPAVYDDVKVTTSWNPRYREDYEAQVTLEDGRRLYLRIGTDGHTLVEQRYSPEEDAWTSPRVIVKSSEDDPCQGISIAEGDGVVAVTVDFGLYCYDGEPPNDSVAAASSGDLATWDVDHTASFDGWTSELVSEGEAHWRAPDSELVWSPEGGFSEG